MRCFCYGLSVETQKDFGNWRRGRHADWVKFPAAEKFAAYIYTHVQEQNNG